MEWSNGLEQFFESLSLLQIHDHSTFTEHNRKPAGRKLVLNSAKRAKAIAAQCYLIALLFARNALQLQVQLLQSLLRKQLRLLQLSEEAAGQIMMKHFCVTPCHCPKIGWFRHFGHYQHYKDFPLWKCCNTVPGEEHIKERPLMLSGCAWSASLNTR